MPSSASDPVRAAGLAGAAGTPEPLVERLTDRELQVLRLVADGLSSKEIATTLGISSKTVTFHRYRMLQKIGVATTVLAVRWAIRNGLIER